MLVSKLGQGQFGVVYKATHQETDETYAVKTIEKKKINSNPKLKKLFETEMSIMSQIHHPNILHLYEYLETANNYYLVINYCNGGDLEEHLKKNGALGEEESKYFVMQIMNGFKELHKHKIIHRDFKLANIFLHDDAVIIGDFGFAKSGVDMAVTKLGSPITMAPELLNAGNNTRYTNKADLWSVGVCFYQLIYGKVPWDVKNIGELQKKVKEESGSRLKFPSSPEVSNTCKELLRRLLDANPDSRIEWKDFFNHKLFENVTSNDQQMMNANMDMKQSVMFRNNEDKVKQIFKANRAVEDPKEIELVDPLEVKVDARIAYKDPKTGQEDVEKAINQIKSRFTHEKKIIVYIMHTCRKMRNLGKKEKDIGKPSHGFMFCGLLLLRKGILMNETAFKSVQDRVDSFKMAKWDEFCKHPSSEKIKNELIKDNVLYYTLLNHLQMKLKEEIGVNNEISSRVYKLSNDKQVKLESIQAELKQQTLWLLDSYKNSVDKYTPAIAKEMQQGIASLFLSTENETEFAYKNTNNIMFDWNEFEKKQNLNNEADKLLIQKAMVQYNLI
jgi:serine/threonine protein kinase